MEQQQHTEVKWISSSPLTSGMVMHLCLFATQQHCSETGWMGGGVCMRAQTVWFKRFSSPFTSKYAPDYNLFFQPCKFRGGCPSMEEPCVLLFVQCQFKQMCITSKFEPVQFQLDLSNLHAISNSFTTLSGMQALTFAMQIYFRICTFPTWVRS